MTHSATQLACLVVLATIVAGCTAGGCPSDVQELRDPSLKQRIGPDLVAGTAVVHRFVDTPDLEFRGYDISITSAVVGLEDADQVMFVAVQNPLPAVDLGDDVLVVGSRGPKPNEIRPAGCPVLVPISP